MVPGDFALTFNLIGILFGVAPSHPPFAPVLSALHRGDLLDAWPTKEPEKVREIAAVMYRSAAERIDMEAFRNAYEKLLVGPTQLQAPPWGSVYLDKEHLLYGPSTLQLQAFLRQEALDLEADHSGPEDHFASLCWLAAWLANQNRMESFDILLGEHLLPWAFIYLDQFELASRQLADDGNEEAAFYTAAAQLARLLLQEVKATRCINVQNQEV